MKNTPLLPDQIPDLDTSQQLATVDHRTEVALDALALEKTMIDQLVVTWLDALRPEMERMAEEMVRRSAQKHWDAQAQKLSAES